MPEKREIFPILNPQFSIIYYLCTRICRHLGGKSREITDLLTFKTSFVTVCNAD